MSYLPLHPTSPSRIMLLSIMLILNQQWFE